MVAASRQKNPKKLIALDLFDWKLDIAKKAGADLGVKIICLSYLSLLCPARSSSQSVGWNEPQKADLCIE